MKHRTADLEGDMLDAAVAKALGLVPIPGQPPGYFYWEERGIPASGWWTPTTDWQHGGPIIQRERISIRPPGVDHDWINGNRRRPHWDAFLPPDSVMSGPTALVAAMRAFVASKFGDEVEL